MTKNAWLMSLAEPLLAEVRSEFEIANRRRASATSSPIRPGVGRTKRRVIVKAEMADHIGRQPKDNLRFLVTNLKTSPRHVYEHVYCARGDVENRLKELKPSWRSTVPVARVSSPTSCGC